jgi:hypothetical protein
MVNVNVHENNQRIRLHASVISINCVIVNQVI